MGLEEFKEKVAKVGDLLIELVEECARGRAVYMLDEMYDAAIKKLVERADSIGDVKTIVMAAVMLGMCKGVYLRQSFVAELDRSLAWLYLCKLAERFGGKEVRKDETESEEAGV